MKIKVCFYVMFDSMAPKTLIRRMLEDSSFDVRILVTPYITKGKVKLDELFENYNRLYKEFGEIVLCSYQKGKFVEFNTFDFVCISDPYEEDTYYYYTIKYAKEYNMHPFFIIYGYVMSKWYETIYEKQYLLNLWRYFAENNFICDELINKAKMPKEKIVLSGYAKMDSLFYVPIRERNRKCIIVASHHTIINRYVYFSNFLEYADFFLKLPNLYPDIDFVFRPHPLLIANLVKDEFWGKEKTEAYFAQLESLPNVIYQKGGDYFDIFVNSDALIHDCGSFSAEYLYTSNPACYMLKDSGINEKNYNAFAKECIAHHYQAFNEEDIIYFINEVVLKEKDTMKQKRLEFTKKLKINYPNVSNFIIKTLKDEFMKMNGNYQ